MYQYQRITPYWAAWMPPIDSVVAAVPVQQIINDNDTINVGNGSINSGGNPSPVTVTNVTNTYTVLATDYMICVGTSTNKVTITLPTSILGTVYVIKDCTGDANINQITIQGTGGQLIDGASATINSPYGSIQLIFNGSEWSIV